MANHISRERRLQILHLLVEGNSCRSIQRLTGAHLKTILRHLVDAGEHCRRFLHLHLQEIRAKHVQCDEIWTFAQKKQARLTEAERDNPNLGDQFLFVAIEQKTKLICSYAIGKRTAETTHRFIEDLSRRLVLPDDDPTVDKPQISTDGWQAYPDAIASSFGRQVRYGQLIKSYDEGEQEGRYGPPDVVSTRRIAITEIENKRTICTSHVERNNLTIRTFMKRFTRLSLGFSKKVDNLRAAVALHVAHYNFCRMHGTLKRTPAIAAGLTNRIWKLQDVMDYST